MLQAEDTVADPLKKISIEGFKSIRQVELSMEPINILIGANGAGKSNFVQVFELLRAMVDGQLQVHTQRMGGAESLLHFGSKHTEQLKLFTEFGVNEYEAVLESTASDALFFESEQCVFHGDHVPTYCEQLGSGHLESKLSDTARDKPGKVASYVLGSIKNWRLYHFHDTSRNAPIKKAQNIDDNAELRSDARNLAAFLLKLQTTHHNAYRRIVEAIQQVAPFFHDFHLRPDPRDTEHIKLEWRERGSDSYFGPSALSDGTLRFMCLATLLLQPDKPTAILIDEPELGLHPFAIHQLASLIRSAATESQLIVSTQSVTLINQFGPTDVVVVDKHGAESTFRRCSDEEVAEWLDEYALGEIWEKNLIGGRPS